MTCDKYCSIPYMSQIRITCGALQASFNHQNGDVKEEYGEPCTVRGGAWDLGLLITELKALFIVGITYLRPVGRITTRVFIEPS